MRSVWVLVVQGASHIRFASSAKSTERTTYAVLERVPCNLTASCIVWPELGRLHMHRSVIEQANTYLFTVVVPCGFSKLHDSVLGSLPILFGDPLSTSVSWL